VVKFIQEKVEIEVSQEELNSAIEEMSSFNDYQRVNLSDLVKHGYVVAIEGDNDFYGYNGLKQQLQKIYKDKFLFLGNIYKDPEQLKQLKNLNVDVFIYQTTGIKYESLKALQEYYLKFIKTVPSNIISLFEDDIYRFNSIFKNVNFFTLERYQSKKCKYEEVVLQFEFTSSAT